VRWLLLKDLQILRRSPLLVSLLVIYPIAIGAMIAVALSSPPGKPRVAILNQVPRGQGAFSLNGERVDASKYANRLYASVDAIRVSSQAEARQKVQSGEALAALIIPPDITAKLASGIEQPTITILLNSANPLQREFVDQTIKARLADANQALSGKFTRIAAGYIRLLLTGGSFSLLGQNLDILGLQRAQGILSQAERELPRGSAARDPLARVISFSKLAIDNLNLSGDVLRSVGSPVKVKRIELAGSTTPAASYGVAIAVTLTLMFVTLGLAAGMLALEREENAFGRLVRGLVSRTGLLVEKTLLTATCAAPVGLLMSAVIAALGVSLRWGRFPLWVLALFVAGLAFAALGVAIGALAREVRAASLLAFLGSLPIAFLALVPANAVSSTVGDLLSAVSAVFPFKPALQAISAALTGSSDPGLPGPLLHLLVLALGFGALARVAIRRF